MYFYFKSEKPHWFQRNPVVNVILQATIFVYIAGVCACRIYLGRHSLDQVVLGL